MTDDASDVPVQQLGSDVEEGKPEVGDELLENLPQDLQDIVDRILV